MERKGGGERKDDQGPKRRETGQETITVPWFCNRKSFIRGMTQNHVWETGRVTVRIAVWLFGGLDSSISLEERKCLRDPADAKPALRLLLPLTRPHPAVWLHVHASLDTARTCYDNNLVVLC